MTIDKYELRRIKNAATDAYDYQQECASLVLRLVTEIERLHAQFDSVLEAHETHATG